MQDATREQAWYETLRRSHADTLWLRTDGANDWATLWMFLGRRDAAIDSLQLALADTIYPFTTRAALRVNRFWGPLKSDQKFERVVGAE